MSLSRHERSLLVVTILVALFGVLGLQLRPRLDKWRERLIALRTLRAEREQGVALIAMGPQWRQHYENVKDQMPVFEPGKQVDTHWMSIMDRLADRYGVSITRRQTGNEKLVGDVYEFSTDCQWEAPLDTFAEFLCAMQEAGAMLDVRDLTIRTHGNRKGFLRGNFTLHCAYMRGEEGTEEPDAELKAESSKLEVPSSMSESPKAEEPESPKDEESESPTSEVEEKKSPESSADK